MKKGLMEIVFILDRSGSMRGLEGDTIGGFNAMLDRQRSHEGEVLISTVLFSNASEVVHDRIALRHIQPLSDAQYVVGGCTALLDAVGDAVRHIRSVHKYARAEDVPERTLFVITTDGMENASRRYDVEQIRQLIERQQKEYGWEFLFLGANIDAIGTAKAFGISEDHAADYRSDALGTQLSYEALGDAIGAVRRGQPLNKSWKAQVVQDHQGRR